MRSPVSIILLLVAGLAFASIAGDAAGQDVRQALLESSLHDLEGEKVDLATFENEVVVLNFWAEWCAPCRKELPVLDSWSQELEGQSVRFVAVSIDRELRKAQRLADDLGLSMPLYHDGPSGLAAALDLPALPTTYLLAPDGRTVFTGRGSSAEALASLRRAIDDAVVAQGSMTPVDLERGAKR